MHSVAKCVMGVVAIACSFSAAARGEAAKVPALIYSPWTKACSNDSCFMSIHALIESGCSNAIAVMFSERTGEAKTTLRIILPRTVNIERGVRIIIDQSAPIERPYTQCDDLSCVTDYEAGPELRDQLKHGMMLVVEAVDSTNAPVSLTLPLQHFSDAYDGSAFEIKPFLRRPAPAAADDNGHCELNP